MALQSPRFRSSRKLAAASNGSVIRKGARGRHVHLVQIALMDLGHTFPRSTGGAYSPDGIYGDETKQKIMDFQRANNLSVDGEIGPNTMGALDNRFRNNTHRVTLHYRSISLTTVPFSESESSAITMYGQYGIDISFGSGMSLMMSEAEEQQFNQVDETCRWDINDGEVNQLHSRGGSIPSNQIGVFYVKAFADANLLGCGGHATNRPACTVAAAASRWDTAHEVGHVLLTSSFSPVHTDGERRNLMFPFSTNALNIPVLNDKQLSKIRQSVCCSRI